MRGKVKYFMLERIANFRRLTPVLIILVTVLLVIPAAAQKPADSHGDSRFTSLDKTRIYYQSYGKGPEAIVLIHGWSCRLDYWRDQIPEFAKRTRVIAIDLPGQIGRASCRERV